jgi:hypothetical protein
MLQIFLNSISHGLWPVLFKFLVVLLPISIPIMLLAVFWIVRLRWLQTTWIEKNGPSCLLEIRLPKEMTKSPAGMEIFFSYLTPGGASNYGEAFLDGRVRHWFSCEIVSINGEVKFYVWCSSRARFKDIVESQLYAQYPNIEIHEVDPKDDYTKAINFDLEKYRMFGLQYKYTKPDPYPIKTYIDYGLDRELEEENKIDPMTSVIEFLGSMKKGENIWMQIMVRRHEKEGWKHGIWEKHGRDIKKEVEKEIEGIRKKTLVVSGDEQVIKFPNPTKGQNEVIAALERVSAKPQLDCMIRSLYISEKNSFNIANIGGLIGSLRQYNSSNMNGFKPNTDAMTDVSDLAKDFGRILPFIRKANEKEVAEIKSDLFHAYKLRSFFEWPYKNYGGKPFVISTEELATIFHFPSITVSQTPTLKRIPSKKSEAPANLPI